RIEQAPVRANHFGYLPGIIDERDKRRRNLELLAVQLEQERTPFTCFNIGTEHAAMGEFSAALDWFQEALALARRHEDWKLQPFATLLVQRTITALRAVGDPHQAIELATHAIGWWPTYTDLYYERAAAYAQLERWNDVHRDANRAIELGPAPAP